MAQSRWDPFAGLASLQREINRLVEDFVEGGAPWGQDRSTQKPAVEVTDTPEALIVRVQVPGISKDDLHLTVTPETLTIRGEVRAAEAGQNVFQREFRYGPFSRTVPLPVTVQAEQASAQLKDGILTVTLPKSAQAQGRDIPIQT
jgi:HSP20 family protein